MRRVTVVLLCSAWAGHGRRTHATSRRAQGERIQRTSCAQQQTSWADTDEPGCNHEMEPLPSTSQARVEDPLKSFATLLLAGNKPTAGWQASWPFRHSFAETASEALTVPASQPRALPPIAVSTEQDIQFRRFIYNTLSPLDRGDFRWEFLVPWTNKTLTATDKFIVCSTFVGLSFTLQTLADPGASVGVHLSYIAQFFSYVMGDPIGFRLLAVLTSVLEILGNVFEQKSNGLLVSGLATPDVFKAIRETNDEDVFPVFYDELFIIINSYYILRWVLSREEFAAALDWSDQEEELYTKCFAGLGFRRTQFSRLLQKATFVEAGDSGDTLTVQGRPIYDLFVPLGGEVEVRLDGKVATTLPPYKLVGEASLLENLQSPGGELHPLSRATVVAAPGSAYVRWPQAAFYELQQEEDSDFAYAIQLMIARQLSDKLKEARLSQRQAESAAQGKSALGEAGFRVEMKALVERGQWYEKRVKSLEKSLDQSKQELDDLKKAILVATGLGGVAVAILIEDVRLALP